MDISNQKIYFDLDGVLADFDTGVRELCHLEPFKQGSIPGKDIELFKAIKEVPHFYYRLKPITDSLNLFNKIYAKYGNNCVILTGIPRPRREILTAEQDKKDWVKKYLSKGVKVYTVWRIDKANFADHNCLLIDDYERNIKEWEERGGKALLFTNAQDLETKLIEMNIL